MLFPWAHIVVFKIHTAVVEPLRVLTLGPDLLHWLTILIKHYYQAKTQRAVLVAGYGYPG